MKKNPHATNRVRRLTARQRKKTRMAWLRAHPAVVAARAVAAVDD